MVWAWPGVRVEVVASDVVSPTELAGVNKEAPTEVAGVTTELAGVRKAASGGAVRVGGTSRRSLSNNSIAEGTLGLVEVGVAVGVAS